MDLSEWFGHREANDEYAAVAETMATYVAVAPDDTSIGVALIARHFPASADVHLLAVRRARHRRGVGRAPLDAVDHALRAVGVRILTVKTLGPSDPDESYRCTRTFYEAVGFVPLEELRGIWDDAPCLLMAKPLT